MLYPAELRAQRDPVYACGPQAPPGIPSAETVGFEPTNALRRYFLSREAPSTRLGHLSSIRSCYMHSSELRISGEEASYFLQYRYAQSWRDGRADECAGLENQWAFAGPGGSNPPPSALKPTDKSSIQIQFTLMKKGSCPHELPVVHRLGAKSLLAITLRLYVDRTLPHDKYGPDYQLRLL